MRRYFFDLDDGVAIRDSTGQNFADFDGAQTEAFRRAADYAGNIGNLRSNGAITVTVRDGPDAVVARVRLVCRVEIP